MAVIKLKGTQCRTIGTLPVLGSTIPDFALTAGDLSDKTRASFANKKIIFNIFPSIDTETCSQSVRQFNSRAAGLADDVIVLCVSRDLPFAQARFCGAEGLERVVTLSSLRDDSFGRNFGVTIVDGPLAGLLSRAIVVSDTAGKVVYTQQVDEVTDEPDYDAALKVF